MRKAINYIVLCVTAMLCSCGHTVLEYDVVIVGGGTSGTAAAIQAARSGATVLLVEEFQWLGGMLTSAGVSATDGCYRLRGGIWDEFRDSLEAYYGGPDALKTGWVSNVLFEPSVGNRIFCNMAGKEQRLAIKFNSRVSDFVKTRDGWRMTVSETSSGRPVSYPVSSRVLIDATELGDVAKAVGVGYDIGMESREMTGEDIAPEEPNGIVQDLTYVMVLKDFGHPVPIPEPDGYCPSEFACSCINRHCVCPKEEDRLWSPQQMIDYGKLPGGKYMINWPIEGNDYYADVIELDKDARDSVFRHAKERSLRFLYFIQNELGMANLGMSDEFPTCDGFPFIPYFRESRRIDGEVRFNLNDIISPYNPERKLYRTAIAVGDYPVDQHHTRYDGWENLPDLYFHAVPSYGVPAGVMIPEGVDDMLVIEKSVSVTNIVNGTTRLQPVVLQLGQAAGVLAAIAASEGITPADVPVRDVQKSLLDAGAYILPLLDVSPEDPGFGPLQRIGATGIIRFEGRTEGWENQTFIGAFRKMVKADLAMGLKDFYSGTDVEERASGICQTIGQDSSCVGLDALCSIVAELSGRPAADVMDDITGILPSGYDRDSLSRLDCALAIDSLLDPFGSFDVDLEGNIIPENGPAGR